jgi:palmitoyltransferase ZDHHC13/17
MASTTRATSADPPRTPSAVGSTGQAPATPPRATLEDVELSNVQNGSAIPPTVPLEGDIMQCARLGEIELLQKMFESGKFNAQYKDEEGITPLHVSFGGDLSFWTI